MIILDTHIWIWWIDESPRLTTKHQETIATHQADGLGLSIISAWEVAKLVEKNKLVLSCPVDEWLNTALAYPSIQVLPLTLSIIVQSTQLLGFHNDPSDQIIVATAMIHQCPLLTVDEKILVYPNVQTLK